MRKIPKKNDRPDIDRYGRNDFINSVIKDDIKLANKIIKKRIDVNIQDDNLWTALHFACQNFSEKMVKLLLENGAEPNIQDINGNTPISTALFNIKDENSNLIYLLKEFGADPNIKNNYGISAIDLAIQVDNKDLKKYFPEVFS